MLGAGRLGLGTRRRHRREGPRRARRPQPLRRRLGDAALHGRRHVDAIAAAAPFVGWPARFWSDNAKAFTATLAAALAPIGVAASHTRPYSPQSNGKAERFHQTVQKWLAKQPRATTVDELQAQLDLFRIIYNTQRPHAPSADASPADVWTHAPKSGPSDRPLGQPTTVHDSTVHAGKCYAGRYAISVGTAHNGQHALTVITGTTGHVFIDGHLIRQLTINPNQRTQPLHHRSGRPTAGHRPPPRALR